MSNIFFLISVAIALVTFNWFRVVVYTFKDFTLKFEIGYLGRIFITSLTDEKLSTISDTFFPIIWKQDYHNIILKTIYKILDF